MLSILRLALKNILSRKSSAAIVLFVSAAISLLVVINSVFDCTEYGIEEVFKNSFTGDFVIRPKATAPLSLFGDETPFTGELSEIPELFPYENLCDFLSENEKVRTFFPQILGMGIAQSSSVSIPFNIFGVDASEYFDEMSAISLKEGRLYENGEKGALLCRSVAQKFNVKTGDEIQFIVSDGPTFRIRAAKITGIYDWNVPNTIMEKFCLVEPSVVRSLMNVAEAVYDSDIPDEKVSLFDYESDFDDLFMESSDTGAVQEIIEEVSEDVESVEVQKSLYWNFIIGKVCPGENPDSVIRELNKNFKKFEWNLEAVSWRNAAGNTALYLYWMRFIFNVGILIVLFAGFVIVNNTLVINVLERISEIGTLRSIGSSKSFIALLFMAETLFLTLFSGIAGSLSGSLMAAVIKKMQIGISNDFLIQLFGGTVLVTKVTFSNLGNCFALSVVLGLLAWIYPVYTALSVSPVSAMNGAR